MFYLYFILVCTFTAGAFFVSSHMGYDFTVHANLGAQDAIILCIMLGTTAYGLWLVCWIVKITFIRLHHPDQLKTYLSAAPKLLRPLLVIGIASMGTTLAYAQDSDDPMWSSAASTVSDPTSLPSTEKTLPAVHATASTKHPWQGYFWPQSISTPVASEPATDALAVHTPTDDTAPQDTQQTGAQIHTVAAGESLWVIAEKYLPPGTPDRDVQDFVDTCYQWNVQLIGENPHLIHPGQQLKIPASS